MVFSVSSGGPLVPTATKKRTGYEHVLNQPIELPRTPAVAEVLSQVEIGNLFAHSNFAYE